MKIYDYTTDLLRSTHLLIGGTPGSGKSVFMTGLILNCLSTNIAGDVVICDPKRVDYIQFKNAPGVISYCDTIPGIITILKKLNYLMELRYKNMQSLHQNKTTEKHIYLFIDEIAFLLTDRSTNKVVTPLIKNLAILGRAAGIHVILSTQRPTSDILNKSITCCFECFIALRTSTAQESRNLIGVAGAESLPRVGSCLIKSPMYTEIIERPVMYYQDQEIKDFLF